MSLKLSHLTLVSVSALSLSVLAGCSQLKSATSQSQEPSSKSSQVSSSSQVFSQQSAPAVSSGQHDPYDKFYGSPKAQDNTSYQPKIIRKYTKPMFKTTAPKRYVVQKGDTLWAISNKFLNNPAYWPEIWDKNQKVKNPHLIYPGDVLYIYEGGRRNIRMGNGSVVEKMVPQMRIERKGAGQAISTLSPFLIWPRVLNESEIKAAPYIVDGRDAHMLIEKDQTVFIKNLADKQSGGRYAVFHQGEKLVDPDTGKFFGHEVTYSGFLEVDQPAMGADVATASVVESKREMRRGDRLLFIEDQTHKLDAPIKVPTHKVRGTIISLTDANMISAQTQIVVINKGARNGIKAGYSLGVYSPGITVNDPVAKAPQKNRWSPITAAKVGIPPQKVATAIVYKTTADLSYALITHSTHHVKNGYKIGNP